MERFKGPKAGTVRGGSGGFGTNWSGPIVFPDVQSDRRPEGVTGGDLGSPPRTLPDRIQIFPWVAFIPRVLKFNFPGVL